MFKKIPCEVDSSSIVKFCEGGQIERGPSVGVIGVSEGGMGVMGVCVAIGLVIAEAVAVIVCVLVCVLVSASRVGVWMGSGDRNCAFCLRTINKSRRITPTSRNMSMEDLVRIFSNMVYQRVCISRPKTQAGSPS